MKTKQSIDIADVIADEKHAAGCRHVFAAGHFDAIEEMGRQPANPARQNFGPLDARAYEHGQQQDRQPAAISPPGPAADGGKNPRNRRSWQEHRLSPE